MAAENADKHEHHDHTMLYVKVWAALLVLLVISVLGPEVGSALNMPALTLFTAFGIAVIKAGMVIKFFMHIDHELRLVWYILTGAIILMFLFFFGTAADVMNHEGSRWVNVAAKAEVARGLAADDGHGAHGDHGDAHDDGHKDDAHKDDHGGAHPKPDAGGHH